MPLRSSLARQSKAPPLGGLSPRAILNSVRATGWPPLSAGASTVSPMDAESASLPSGVCRRRRKSAFSAFPD